MSSLFIFMLSLVLIIIDQVIKFIASNNLNGEISAVGGLISFTYVRNFGAAFGILQDKRYIFIIATVIILSAFICIIAKRRKVDKLLGLSSVFIIGGGLSNMIDRMFRGYVIDYIKVLFFPAVCNFADYCITVGVVIFCIRMIISDRTERKS